MDGRVTIRGPVMSEIPAAAVLLAVKPLAKRLIYARGLYTLSEADLALLKALKQLIETTTYAQETALRQAADLTSYELALLLGTLTLQSHPSAAAAENSTDLSAGW